MIETASLLLAKAERTTSESEALALVERSYALLAQVINAYDDRLPADGATRRRERRGRRDRRRLRADSGAAPGVAPVVPDGPASSIARYLGASGDRRGSEAAGVDLSL